MTESDLYAMAMESQTAYKHMEELCKRLGYEFPPRLEYPPLKDLDDPFKGLPAPVTLAFNSEN